MRLGFDNSVITHRFLARKAEHLHILPSSDYTSGHML